MNTKFITFITCLTVSFLTACGSSSGSDDEGSESEDNAQGLAASFEQTTLDQSSLPSVVLNMTQPSNTTWATANMLATAESWVANSEASYTAEEAEALAESLDMNSETGWPNSLPENAYIRIIPSYIVSQTKEALENVTTNEVLTGVFVLTWEGSGDVEVKGSSANGIGYQTLLSEDNRIVFQTWETNQTPAVFIYSIDSEDPISNMRLWAPIENGGGSELTVDSNLAAGEISASTEPAPGEDEPLFHPKYLEYQRSINADLGRYMAWLTINGNYDDEDVDWDDRARAGYSFGSFSVIDESYIRYDIEGYNQRVGLPYEWMIELSNELERDLWIQVSHNSSDDLIEGLAELIAETLDPDLNVWIEYSNELWNPVYSYLPQVNKAKQTYADAYGVDFDDVSNISAEHGWGSGQLVGHFLQTFENRWSELGESDDRLINVVAGFTGSTTYNQAMIDSVREIDEDLVEVLAITNYFGSSIATEVYDSYEFGEGTSEWPDSVYETAKDAAQRSIESTADNWSANATLAESYGIPMVSYEGGQHILATGLGDWDDPSHADFMRFLEDFQYSDEMESLYQLHTALWAEAGGLTISQFVDFSAYSFFGYWGALEYLGQDWDESVKMSVMDNWVEINEGVRSKSEPLDNVPEILETEFSGEAGIAMSEIITYSGGDGDVTLELLGGDLPAGLELDFESGVAYLSGTPTVSGTFIVVVRAKDSDGDVDDEVINLNIGLEGSSTNSLVSFDGSQLTATEGSIGSGRYDPVRSTEIIGDNSEQLVLPFNMDEALFEDEYSTGTGYIEATSQLNMYGGYSVVSNEGDDDAWGDDLTPYSYTGLRDSGFNAWVGDSYNATDLHLLLMWKDDQFTQLGSGEFGFGDDETEAALRIDFSSLPDDGSNEIRFVVQHDDGDEIRWYISEAAYTEDYVGDGVFELTAFNNSSDAGKRWAEYSPQEYDVSIPDANTLTFSAKSFDDVQAVGFAYHGSRWQYHYLFTFDAFSALGVQE